MWRASVRERLRIAYRQSSATLFSFQNRVTPHSTAGRNLSFERTAPVSCNLERFLLAHSTFFGKANGDAIVRLREIKKRAGDVAQRNPRATAESGSIRGLRCATSPALWIVLNRNLTIAAP